MKPIEPIKEHFGQVFGGNPAVISAAPGRVEFILKAEDGQRAVGILHDALVAKDETTQ